MLKILKKIQRGERSTSERVRLQATADRAIVTIVYDSRGKVVAAR